MDTPWPSFRAALAVASALIAVQQVNWVPSLGQKIASCQREDASAPAPTELNKGRQHFRRLVDQGRRLGITVWQWLRSRLAVKGSALGSALATRSSAVARGCFTILVLKYLEKRLDKDLGLLPGSLAGLVLVVGFLWAVDKAGSARRLTQVEQFCAPALSFLTEWMPIFFAPPLVALPARLYRDGMPKRELSAIAGVLCSGFLTGLVATSWVTGALLRWQARKQRHREEENQDPLRATVPNSPNMHHAYASVVQDPVRFGLGALLVILSVARNGPWRDRLLLAVVTALSYRLGTQTVPKRWQRILHPVLTCAGITAIVTSAVELSNDHVLRNLNNAPWYQRLEHYPNLAGNWFMQLLGPSLIALAFRLYRARALLRRHLLPLVGGSAFAAVFSLLWTMLASRAFGVTTPALRRALLPRSITMPLAIASANRLGADSGITVASVLISGILGAGLGPMVLSLGPEKLAVARGVALGSVSHGLGTAALAASGDSVGASAAVIALGLVGTLTTLLLSSSLARWMTR
jgi:putative effector of murein hydrolase/putative effector of murein hydrolase LrgA (UPF0299 family)